MEEGEKKKKMPNAVSGKRESEEVAKEVGRGKETAAAKREKEGVEKKDVK